MPRLSLAQMISLAACPLWLMAATASAQDAPPPAEAPPAEEPPAEEPPPLEAPPAPAPVAPPPVARTAQEQRNRDIMVVPHRYFLKTGRLEVAPSAGININDNLISDFSFGGEANYFLSEAFAVGLLFQYFPTPGGATDLETDIRRRYHKFPTHNEYVFAGMAGVSYAPIYGKFTLFGGRLVHWDAYVGAGGGLVQTKTVPRDGSLEPLTNNNPAGNVSFGGRFFLSRWLSALFNIRDYVFVDKFEKEGANRPTESRFVNNVMLSLGAAVYFPMDFKYTTLR
jgi:outer membrane beta-barrel protein